MKVERPLTTEERQLLIWLLEHGEPEAKQYLSQVTDTTVVGICECGCPAIDLAVKGKQANGSSLILADYTGKSPEGASIGGLVYARDGQLSELEVYKFADEKQKVSLPHPEALTPWKIETDT